ncbi:hypothetical protein BpHYR1_040406 [Brachionus plicatilis]|uniref:Uncharacterized protein n=1 Tax=Brachionus plicatilis TaxID=10195 RepID=A0A3M7QQV3_BRAPC|nr:hypothetical protein BpHYR1_040406 [Brachionus plicatilis]
MEAKQNWAPREKVENRAKKNVTQMVILIAFNYSFGTIPYAMYYGLHELLQTRNSFIDYTLCAIGNAGLRLLIIFKIIVFFRYNKVYRNNFRVCRGKLTKKCSFHVDQKLCVKL